MNLMGIDWGKKRVGVAVCDKGWSICSPLKTFDRSVAVKEITALSRTHEIGRFVMGVPFSLREADISSDWGGFPFFEELKKNTGLPFSWADETMTTSGSYDLMSGMKYKARRERVDMVSASLILDSFIQNARRNKRTVLAVTGNIGTGKSFVARKMAEMSSAVHLDADVLARSVMEPGGQCYEAVRAEFGPDYFGADGVFDRNKMGELVFADPGMLKRLNAILHPHIRRRIRDAVSEVTDGLVILEIPLVAENKLYYLYDFSLLTKSSNDVIISRVKSRDSRRTGEINDILERQADPLEIGDCFDTVVDTSDGWESYKGKIINFLNGVVSFRDELIRKGV